MDQSILIGAFVFGALTAIGIGVLSRSRRVSEDTAVGVIFAALFALGVVLISRQTGFRQDLERAALRQRPRRLLERCLRDAGHRRARARHPLRAAQGVHARSPSMRRWRSRPATRCSCSTSCSCCSSPRRSSSASRRSATSSSLPSSSRRRRPRGCSPTASTACSSLSALDGRRQRRLRAAVSRTTRTSPRAAPSCSPPRPASSSRSPSRRIMDC